MGLFEDRGKDATSRAITAVRAGLATREQEELARRAAKQAGSVGNSARSAFDGK